MVDNLYAYGPPHGATIREDLPYAATNRKGRARAWVAERFMAAHAAGDVGVTIARASDYFGRGAVESAVGGRFFGPILAGKAAAVFGDPDAPHSITYVPDFARTLIELAHHDEALVRPGMCRWSPPSLSGVSPSLSERQPEPERRGSPACPARCCASWGCSFQGAAETVEMLYEFEEPFVLDSSRCEKAFGLKPTPFAESIPATVAWWRDRAAQARK